MQALGNFLRPHLCQNTILVPGTTGRGAPDEGGAENRFFECGGAQQIRKRRVIKRAEQRANSASFKSSYTSLIDFPHDLMEHTPLSLSRRHRCCCLHNIVLIRRLPWLRLVCVPSSGHSLSSHRLHFQFHRNKFSAVGATRSPTANAPPPPHCFETTVASGIHNHRAAAIFAGHCSARKHRVMCKFHFGIWIATQTNM